MFDFRRITLFCLEQRLSKHKMTIFSKNLGEAMAPLVPPGYAYASIACAFASFQHNMTRMDLVQTASKAYTGGISEFFVSFLCVTHVFWVELCLFPK